MSKTYSFWRSRPRWVRFASTGLLVLACLYWLTLWAFVTVVLGEPAFGDLFDKPRDTAALVAAQADPELRNIVELDGPANAIDLQPVMTAIADTPVVGIGEASHGSHEFFTFRQALAKRLITERGFQLIGIEAGAADGRSIDGYINGSDDDLDTVMSQQKFWIYDTSEFREIATWLRQENAKRPASRRIHLYGYDVQDFDKEAALLLAHLEANGHPTSEFSALKNPKFDDSAFLQSLSEDQLSTKISLATSALRQVQSIVTGQPQANNLEYSFAVHLVKVMQTRLALMQTKEFDQAYTLRDRSMAENIQWARGQNNDAPIMLWAHNGHIGKSTLSGEAGGPKMMGSALNDIYADRYMAIGMVFKSGGFVAHTPSSMSPHFLMRSFALSIFGDVSFPLSQTSTPPIPQNRSLAVFEKAQRDIAFLDVRRLSARSPLRKLLASDQPYPMPGAVYMGPSSARWELALTPMFDALVVFKTVSASQNRRVGNN